MKKMPLIVIMFLVLLLDPVYAQQKEWNDSMAGAKKEGRVVVATSPDPVMREIAAKFKARFGITLEHLAGSSSQLAARLQSERQAAINSVDVFLGGIQTVANVLYPQKMLDPLKPSLMLPEVVESKKWKKGRPWFVDPEEMYVATEDQGLWYSANRRAASPVFTQLSGYPFRFPSRMFFNPYDANEIWVTSFGNGMRLGPVPPPR